MPKLASFFLFAAVAFGDPISVTTLNQTSQTSARTLANDQQCTDSGAFSSSCFSEATGIEGQAVALASASIIAEQFGPSQPPHTNISEEASARNYLSGATALASLTQSVLITGGTGTGYLNVVFTVGAGRGGAAGASIDVGGQMLMSGGSITPVWAVVPFTFGQPFDYSLSLNIVVDNQGDLETSQLTLAGAHVYSAPPTGCTPAQFSPEYGFCSDPNYFDATGALSALTAAPEPNTAWLVLGIAFFPAIKVLRRSRR